MAKDKKSKKNKGAKADKAPALTGKEVKALRAREAELAEAIRRKEKAAKKGKTAAPGTDDKAEKKAAEKARKKAPVDTETEAERKEREFIETARERVAAAKAAREAESASVDRDDAEAVAAHNAKQVADGKKNLHLLTATETVEAEAAKLGDARFATDADGETTEAAPASYTTVEDAGPVVERDHFGRPKIWNPATAKSAPYSRVTTYIDCLEDRTMLEKWKLRTAIEGVAINTTEIGSGEDGELLTAQAAAIIHRRDVALAKVAKADKKGKLDKGERGEAEEAIWKEAKSKLDEIARTALDVGGANVRSSKGTELHELCEIYDREGMVKINEMLRTETITKADHADIVAYAEAMMKAGIEVLECEQMVVLDDLKVAGTLDRLVKYRPAGAARAIKVIADIKTGNIEYGKGKIAQQLDLYAQGKGYDPADPNGRRALGAHRKIGLLIHLPQGKATCTIHQVDLTVGAAGNKLAAAVRAFRNEGKAAYDSRIDVASSEPVAV